MIETKHRVTIVSADEDRLTLEIDGEVDTAQVGDG
jgi:hypothetical protein